MMRCRPYEQVLVMCGCDGWRHHDDGGDPWRSVFSVHACLHVCDAALGGTGIHPSTQVSPLSRQVLVKLPAMIDVGCRQ